MFQKDFVWGVASSAYQIEGTDPQDGRGENIWDVFSRAGRVYEGQNADVACDHMHRYKEDFALMRTLGIKAYRFSVSWSRIMPEGTGEVNQKAIDLYRNMIQEMLKNGITPYVTMYHWEFPDALQKKGGWLNEESIQWFGEYAKVIAENFSDLAEYFITLNEPQCFVGIGNLTGIHAPGYKLAPEEVFQITHNVLRAHGTAVKALRKYAKQDIKIGYAPTCGVAYPASDKPEDIEAAKKIYFGMDQPIENWTWTVAWFSDPVFLGKYPEDGLQKYAKYLPKITEEDMELIHQPLDFMGQNIYNGYCIRQGADGNPEYVARPDGSPKTATNWPVTPECLYWGAKFLYERYHLPIYITENGMSCHDIVSEDGRVHDSNRIDFLDKYLGALQKAADEQVDIRGYFLWTFLDNFEWEKGYNERFGIVYVDFATQKRIVKDSAYWYGEVCKTNGQNLSINQPKKEILHIEPVFKQMVWGGNKLGTEWNYAAAGEGTGECWGVSAHPNGDCMISGGSFDKKTLSQLWKEEPSLFGNSNSDRFPLLIKIIDAEADLSIQVHPNDEYAAKNEGGSLGKTECWYILDAKEDANLVIGHNAKTPEELKGMIAEERWSEFIREVPVKKGDFIQIDPGTVHAIKGGIQILETQQNSDITYRLYDYGRLVDGKPRELHLEKSIDVMIVPAESLEKSVVHVDDAQKNVKNLLIACDYYKVWKLNVSDLMKFEQDEPFLIMSVIEGDGLVNGQYVKKGSHFILPCGYGEVELRGEMQLIASTVVE